jgi:ribokinase
MSVLVAGDANVDLVLRGDVVPRFGQAEQLLDAADVVIGGSASIVAVGLARLGVPVSLAAVLGDDEFGRVLGAALPAAGVDTSHVLVRTDAPTGISVILSAPDDRSILTLPGTVPLLTADDIRRATDAAAPTHVHLASFFLQPALAAELPELLAWLRDRGIRTSLDTNWDPAGLWGGLDRVIPLVDYLLPNREELRAIAAALGVQASDDESAARGLAALGPTVVVKAGADGGWSCSASGEIHRAPGLVLDVVDTTGAGDSFDAGYLAAIDAGIDDEGLRLRWAAVAGSLSTRGTGGTAAQPTRDELLARLDP